MSHFSSANAKWATALEALQLCLKLLPLACRDELCRLLTFMALAADPQEMRLDKEVRAAYRERPLQVVAPKSNLLSARVDSIVLLGAVGNQSFRWTNGN